MSGYLEPDYITVPGQNFALISWVGPEGPAQKNEKYGMKIRGCFATQEDAAAHAKRLQKDDKMCDILVVNMYNWFLCWPSMDEIEDVHYQNEKLEELMSERAKNQVEARRMFEDRKKALMTGSLDPSDDNSVYYNKIEEEPLPHPAELMEKIEKEKPGLTKEEYIKLAQDAFSEAEKKVQEEREEAEKKAQEAEKNNEGE